MKLSPLASPRSMSAGVMGVAALCLSAGAQAAILTPTTASSVPNQGNAFVNAPQTINGSGLSTNSFTEATVASVTHLTGSYNFNNFDTAPGNLGTTAQLIYDLSPAGPEPVLYDLTNAYLWQNSFNLDLARGVKDFSISTSSDGVAYTSAGSFTLAQGSTNPTGVQTFALSGPAALNVRFVRVDIANNYGSQDGVALGEIRFGGDVAAAVPEPATGALLIGALGMLGMRHRRSVK